MKFWRKKKQTRNQQSSQNIRPNYSANCCPRENCLVVLAWWKLVIGGQAQSVYLDRGGQILGHWGKLTV